METLTADLTTAVGILAAYKSVVGKSSTRSKAANCGLLNDLAMLLASKSSEEIRACAATDIALVGVMLEEAYRAGIEGSEGQKSVAAKAISLVDLFVTAGQFRAANDWLTAGYRIYDVGSDEENALLAKALSLVDAFVKAGRVYVADDWLAKGYRLYPAGSQEEGTVVAKRATIAQACLETGDFGSAEGLWENALKIYREGSEEQDQARAKLAELRRGATAAKLGVGVTANVAALKRATQEQLRKLPAAPKSHDESSERAVQATFGGVKF